MPTRPCSPAPPGEVRSADHAAEEGSARMATRIDQFSSPAAAGGGSGTGEVNVWIVGDEEEVIVIDPGTDAAGVLDAVGDREVIAVICTHGHADHIAAALALAERDEAPVALHP